MLYALIQSITPDAILMTALKGVALLAAVWVLTVALRKAPAAWRHAMWLAGLAALMAMPLASTFAPVVEVPLAWTQAQPPVSAQTSTETPRPMRHSNAISSIESSAPFNRPNASNDAVAAQPEPAPPMSQAAAHDVRLADLAAQSASTKPVDWPTVVAGAWLSIALLLIAPYLFGRAMLWRLRHWARPLDDEAWQQVLRDACERLRIQRRVRLLISPRAIVPMTWGVLRPVVLLPHGAQAWDEPRRRMVMVHELAHVRRYDCLSDGFARVVRALHWYNPLVWLALHRLCAERETACDAWVLRLGHTPSSYAAALVDIARDTRHPRLLQAAGLAMARSSKVARRVKQILQPVVSTRGYLRLSTAVAAAFVLVFGTLAAVRVSDAEPTAPKPSGASSMRAMGASNLGGMRATPAPGLEIHIAPAADANAFPRLTLNHLPYDALRTSGIDATTFQVHQGTVYGLEVNSADDFARLLQSASESVEIVTLIVGAADTPMDALMKVMDALKAAGIEAAQVRGDTQFPPGAMGGAGGFGGGLAGGGGGGFGMSGSRGGSGGAGGIVRRDGGRGGRTAEPGWPERLMQMGKESVDAVGGAVVELLDNATPESRHRADVQNMLKQMGLVFKMYANEAVGGRFPLHSEAPGVLQPRIELIYPEYLSDTTIVDFVSNKTEDVVVYTGYAMQDEEDGLAFLQAYREGTLGDDLDLGLDRRLFVLREGIERFFIQDINDPAAGAKEQSEIPIMWTMPGTAGGGNVLFMDGHVEYIEYPGKFPMTEKFITELRKTMAGDMSGVSEFDRSSPLMLFGEKGPAVFLLPQVKDLLRHTTAYMGNSLVHTRFRVDEHELRDLLSLIEDQPAFTTDVDSDHAFGPTSAKTFTHDGQPIELSWWNPDECSDAREYYWRRDPDTGPPMANWLRICDTGNGEFIAYWRASDLPMSHRAQRPRAPNSTGTRDAPQDQLKQIGNTLKSFANSSRPGSEPSKQTISGATIAEYLKSSDAIFRSHAESAPGGLWPLRSAEPGVMQPDLSAIAPEHELDPALAAFLTGKLGVNVVYTGYVLPDEQAGLAFLNAYGNAPMRGEKVETPTSLWPVGNVLLPLSNHCEVFYISDINDPAERLSVQAQLPVMWTMPQNGSAHVLYLDGHVEHVAYPGRFPMRKPFIQGLNRLMGLPQDWAMPEDLEEQPGGSRSSSAGTQIHSN